MINSDARMTYTDVNAILTDRDPDAMSSYAPLVPMFETMRELFEILNARRHRRGSIDFDLPEPESILDDEGMVEAIIAAERNVAHRLIEEFMLLANETVATHLETQRRAGALPHPRAAGPLKVEEFEEFISELGYSLGAPAERGRAAALPEAGREDPRQAGREADRVPDAADDAEGALRRGEPGALRPRRGRATPHFTSPIRRYPDLVVHRALRESRHAR